MTARVVVAGTHSGVGKTTLSAGLAAALASKGLEVACFKVGPDFIDPSYHEVATGRRARNLDPYLSGPELIRPLFLHGASGADVAVIEGVMGLFDGKDGAGELGSTAQVAKLLEAPVLLVVDASGLSRSAAALVAGYAGFDPKVKIAGVILNKVASERHRRLLSEAIEPLGIPVLGALPRRPDLEIPGRHLGLIPAPERRKESREAVLCAGEVAARCCDLDEIMRAARSAPPLVSKPWDPSPKSPSPGGIRVAMASGPAFTFYYEENLELLRARGVEIFPFDPTKDVSLPERTDALLLGGGFPEVFAEELSSNENLRREIQAFAGSGRPIVAECGGLLYLCRSLDGHPMCGVIPADATTTDRPTLGYREATAPRTSVLAPAGLSVRAHEFHYSKADPPAGAKPAWLLGERPEGFLLGGVHASYLHTHWAARPEIPDRLYASCLKARRRCRQGPPLREALRSSVSAARKEAPAPGETLQAPAGGARKEAP